MMTWLFRTGLTFVACTCAAAIASAQAPHQQSWMHLKDRLAVGDVVYVTDANALTIKGRLATVVDEAIQLYLKADTRTIPAANVRRIQRRQPDSPLTGLFIGAGIGAIPGIYWLVADPNECTGMCPEDYVSIGVGALVGWLIDRSISRKVTVYEAQPPGSRSPAITIGPVISPNRVGAQVAVGF